MRFKLLAAAAVGALFAMTSAAHAVEVVSITKTAGYVAPAPGTLITDFNSTGGTTTNSSNPGSFLQGGTITDIAAGFTFVQNSGAYTRDGGAGLDSGMSAPPPADNGVDGAYYETVLTGGSATLTSDVGLSSFSFYMGSPDDYNGLTITIMGQGGSIIETGSQIWGGAPDGTGLQTLGYTITYTFSPGAAHTIEFTSTGNSFEFDRLAGVTVPEPASWALMIGGFGLAGVTLRAKRRQAAAA
jgi:hypothetical protein